MKNKIINLFGKPQVVQNQGEKYSELLEQFIDEILEVVNGCSTHSKTQ